MGAGLDDYIRDGYCSSLIVVGATDYDVIGADEYKLLRCCCCCHALTIDTQFFYCQ